MTAAALAVLAGMFPPSSPPGGRPVDYVVYGFADPDRYARAVSLRVERGGRVTYTYSANMDVGYVPPPVKKEWTIGADEAKALIDHLVADGLLDLSDGTGRGHAHFAAGSGRWSVGISPDAAPDRLTARLRPLLATADPERWGGKAVKPPAGARPEVARMTYTFVTAPAGQAVTLEVTRGGAVGYRRDTVPPARKPVVSAEQTIPAADTAALLDALAADGLFDADAAADGGRYPNHLVQAAAGRWRLHYYPKELPEKAAKRLLPLLQKADPEFWK